MVMLVLITLMQSGQVATQYIRGFETVALCLAAEEALRRGVQPEMRITQRFDCLEVER